MNFGAINVGNKVHVDLRQVKVREGFAGHSGTRVQVGGADGPELARLAEPAGPEEPASWDILKRGGLNSIKKERKDQNRKKSGFALETFPRSILAFA